jgi:Tfp pilus assembly protein PilF
VLLPSIVILSSWVIVLAVAYRRYRGFSFLLLSFLILLLPSSSVIPLKDLIFEYRLYLSLSCWAVASVLALHFFVERFVNQRNRKAFFIAVVSLIALVLGGLTYQRNKIYTDEETVWHDVIRKQPFNSRAFNNLGEYLIRQGRDKEAKPYFLQALALNTTYPDVYVNLATVLGREGHPEEGIEYAKQALALDPHFPVAENNWGSALSQMGRYSEAIPHFEKALELGFVKAGVLQNLGVAYANSGQPFKAVKVLKKALEINPGSEEIQSILDQVLSAMHPQALPPTGPIKF